MPNDAVGDITKSLDELRLKKTVQWSDLMPVQAARNVRRLYTCADKATEAGDPERAEYIKASALRIALQAMMYVNPASCDASPTHDP
jgi:hypothetical protein